MDEIMGLGKICSSVNYLRETSQEILNVSFLKYIWNLLI